MRAFAPLFLERELLSPAPEDAYAGSWTVVSRRGTGWLPVWDDRAARRPDPLAFRAVKAFDRMLGGPEVLGTFASLIGDLRARGIRHSSGPTCPPGAALVD